MAHKPSYAWQPDSGGGGRRGRGGRGRGGGARGGSAGRGGTGRGGDFSGNSRSGQDGEKSHRPSALHYQKLRRMLTSDPTDAVLDLLKHEEQLQNLLEDDRIKEEYMELLLEILAKVYDTHMKENLIKILTLIPNTAFLQKALPRYIMQLPMRSRNAKPEKHIRNIVLLFDQLLRRFPALYTEIPLDSLLVATMNLQSSLQSQISQQVQELVAVRQRIIEKNSRSKDARRRDKALEEEAKPPDDFREISVYPTTDDFKEDKEVFLRKNIVEGKYQNVDHYLDVQFRLLREDFIGPLRDGVNEIFQGVGRSERNQNLRIYRNVAFVDTVCTNSGIVHRIHFDSRHLKKVNWDNSKRLIFGSFLCMSKDNFNTLVFATISERKAEQLKDGYLQVRFLGEIPDLQPGDQFQMVESPGYYEAYCHNLQGLQEMSEEKMSFSRYLVDCETDVHVPSYLIKNEEGAVGMVDSGIPAPLPGTYDLQNALKAKVDARAVPILHAPSWPKVDDVELNKTQLEAVQAALTKEFVVIQGPPGTGKTYVGLRIVQALLKNDQHWAEKRVAQQALHGGRYGELEEVFLRSPMLVVCYTNHALDQFLEEILEFKKDGIVRVGGRSSSELLQEHNLGRKAGRKAAWYVVNDQLRDINRKIETEKACCAKSYNQLLGLEDLSCVMEKREMDQMLPYLHVAEFMGTTVIGAWINMEPLPFYAEGFEDGEEEGDGQEEEEQGAQEEENVQHVEREGANEEGHTTPGNLNEQASGGDETIDVEKDAERLQGERQVGDDEFTPIENPDDVVKMSMTQDFINMVNLRARAARYQEEMKEQHADFVAPDQGLWRLDYNARQNLYQHWLKQFQEFHTRAYTELSQQYDVVCEQMKEIKHGQEEDALRQATVIGMTTTGAAKYRNVLQKIEPRIIVVEEAAEVLEAHIVTALSKGAQHLILIGDHKQLKPNPSVYTLAKQYNLEVSLFERMVRNGMKCYTLDTQHRMRPEIAQLMKHIYDDLKNHVSVENFDDVLGVSKNLFFIDHQHPEKSDDELRSHSNEHESNYIVALCRYLLHQGYDSSKITVLTMYTGQLLELKKLMPKAQFSGVRVCSVDNFQGEENDIILLSLVRSNEERKIGFLGVSNRICVALSRARMGFYCIGNIGMLAEKSELWAKIKAQLENQEAVGPALPIYCRNHKSTKIKAAKAQDFKKAPEGGCTLPCDFRLDCGHKCEMVCHPVDREHLEYECEKPCGKNVCPLDHRCAKRCHYGTPCGSCEKLVTKTLEKCGHKQLMACSANPLRFECVLPCEKVLPCGHPCRSSCGKVCSLKRCQEKVEKTLPCGHQHAIECSTPTEDYKCGVRCETVLDCEHPCPGNCHDCKEGRVHVACQHPCERTLICSHPCKEPCTKDCPSCKQDCENKCMHSACRKKCGEPCTPCEEPCTWNCSHKKCKNKCSEICDRKPCNVQCKAKSYCNKKKHKCVGLCGEKCPKLCRVCDREKLTENVFGTESKYHAQFIELLDCGHFFEVTAFDKYMAMEDDDDVTNIQLKQCPKCKTPIRKSLRYGNSIKKTLMNIELVKKKVLDDGVDRKTKEAELVRRGEKMLKKYPLILKPCEEVYVEGRYKNLSESVIEGVLAMDRVVPSPNRRRLIHRNSAYFDLLYRIRSCDYKELDAVKNQIRLLLCIYEIKSKFLVRIPASREEKRLRAAVNDLEKRLVDLKLTNQLAGDLKEEILRVTLECQLTIVQEDIASAGIITVPPEMQLKLDSISSLLSARKRIRKNLREEASQYLDKICNDMRLKSITAVERARIGYTKGQWFKCRNGHVYAVAESGGAIDKGCPECQEEIDDSQSVAKDDPTLKADGDESKQGNLQSYDRKEPRRSTREFLLDRRARLRLTRH